MARAGARAAAGRGARPVRHDLDRDGRLRARRRTREASVVRRARDRERSARPARSRVARAESEAGPRGRAARAGRRGGESAARRALAARSGACGWRHAARRLPCRPDRRARRARRRRGVARRGDRERGGRRAAASHTRAADRTEERVPRDHRPVPRLRASSARGARLPRARAHHDQRERRVQRAAARRRAGDRRLVARAGGMGCVARRSHGEAHDRARVRVHAIARGDADAPHVDRLPSRDPRQAAADRCMARRARSVDRGGSRGTRHHHIAGHGGAHRGPRRWARAADRRERVRAGALHSTAIDARSIRVAPFDFSAMTIQQSQWAGVFPAITTPFRDDLSVDHDALAAQVTWLADAGCAGIITGGSLGEAATLSFDEKVAINATCVRAIDGRIPVVAGIAGLATAECVALARAAERAGCDGIMALPAYVYYSDWRETREHYGAIIAATPLSCMLYNNPIAYRTDVLPDQLDELA